MSWLPDRFIAFDTETTGVDVTVERIVTANVLTVGVAGVESELAWVLNPGVPIPPEATAVHGITNERAQAEGKDPALTIPLIAVELRRAWDAGLAVVAFNASFDLSIVDAELRRLGLPGLGPLGPVVPMANHYGVKLETAHESRGDALVAARILWRQAKRYPELNGFSLADMQDWQRQAHARWAQGFEEYRAKKGQPVTIDRAWPMRTEVRP